MFPEYWLWTKKNSASKISFPETDEKSFFNKFLRNIFGKNCFGLYNYCTGKARIHKKYVIGSYQIKSQSFMKFIFTKVRKYFFLYIHLKIQKLLKVQKNVNFIFHLIYKFINGFLPKVFCCCWRFFTKERKKRIESERNYILMTSTSSAQKNLIRRRKQSDTTTEKKEKKEKKDNWSKKKEPKTENILTINSKKSKHVYFYGLQKLLTSK